MRRWWTLPLAVALTALGAPALAQDDYPNRPITLVVPLPPGGTVDMMARAVADKLGAALGQQVVVENRAAGGSGTMTTRAVAKGPADGYTILLGYTSTLATGPHTLEVVGQDFAGNWTPDAEATRASWTARSRCPASPSGRCRARSASSRGGSSAIRNRGGSGGPPR